MSWRRIFTSREAWYESKAGACTPPGWVAPPPGDEWPVFDDWPMPKPPPFEADDEGRAEPGASDE